MIVWSRSAYVSLGIILTLDPYQQNWAFVVKIKLNSIGYWRESQNNLFTSLLVRVGTVYPKKYAHGFCFAVLCCGYTLTDFPISIRLTSLALWQSNDCPSASKATLMNMDKYFMWIHYEWLHNHNKAKHNKTVCIFLGIYCNWQLLTTTHMGISRAWIGAEHCVGWVACQTFGFCKETPKLWNMIKYHNPSRHFKAKV